MGDVNNGVSSAEELASRELSQQFLKAVQQSDDYLLTQQPGNNQAPAVVGAAGMGSSHVAQAATTVHALAFKAAQPALEVAVTAWNADSAQTGDLCASPDPLLDDMMAKLAKVEPDGFLLSETPAVPEDARSSNPQVDHPSLHLPHTLNTRGRQHHSMPVTFSRNSSGGGLADMQLAAALQQAGPLADEDNLLIASADYRAPRLPKSPGTPSILPEAPRSPPPALSTAPEHSRTANDTPSPPSAHAGVKAGTPGTVNEGAGKSAATSAPSTPPFAAAVRSSPTKNAPPKSRIPLPSGFTPSSSPQQAKTPAQGTPTTPAQRQPISQHTSATAMTITELTAPAATNVLDTTTDTPSAAATAHKSLLPSPPQAQLPLPSASDSSPCPSAVPEKDGSPSQAGHHHQLASPPLVTTPASCLPSSGGVTKSRLPSVGGTAPSAPQPLWQSVGGSPRGAVSQPHPSVSPSKLPTALSPPHQAAHGGADPASDLPPPAQAVSSLEETEVEEVEAGAVAHDAATVSLEAASPGTAGAAGSGSTAGADAHTQVGARKSFIPGPPPSITQSAAPVAAATSAAAASVESHHHGMEVVVPSIPMPGAASGIPASKADPAAGSPPMAPPSHVLARTPSGDVPPPPPALAEPASADEPQQAVGVDEVELSVAAAEPGTVPPALPPGGTGVAPAAAATPREVVNTLEAADAAGEGVSLDLAKPEEGMSKHSGSGKGAGVGELEAGTATPSMGGTAEPASMAMTAAAWRGTEAAYSTAATIGTEGGKGRGGGGAGLFACCFKSSAKGDD